MFLNRPTLQKSLLFFLIFNLSACSFFVGEDGIFRDRKKDYRKAESMPRIVIPDNLDDKAIVDFYPVPPANPFSNGEMIDDFYMPVSQVNTEAAVKIQKMGAVQWVLLQASASQVWPRLKEFLSQQVLTLTVENGAAGMMEARSSDGLVYRFRIEQGFQRNTSEVSVRCLDSSASAVAFWPELSSDASKEQGMIEQVAQFFANVSDKPAYSFAAQGISTQKKINIEYNSEGDKTLLLMVNQKRAWLTLKQSIEKAYFAIDKMEESQQFLVQYRPVSEEKPGFFAHLFGIKPDPFDKDVKYAGNHYLFQLASDGDQSRVTVKALDVEGQSSNDIRKEQNYILLLLKERLY